MHLTDCIFCAPKREILAENAHALAFLDSFPVSRGHALVVPKRHVISIFDLSDAEYADCFRLVLPLKDLLLARFAPDGFNVGANCGEAGGQSVWHAHIHVIPRYTGDVPDPRGGVRGVIPYKAGY
jgi:diadenosine tetraphosphate (Ap4A) HIT family hydrolase